MTKALELKDRRFGMLVAQEISHRGRRGVFWKCLCDCGSSAIYAASALKAGKVYACGCQRGKHIADAARTHGRSGSPAYKSWENMMGRCRGGKGKSDKWYASKGISVCVRWLSFENFLADMGERPEGKSLDRIDNSQGYEPSNCRWATSKEQAINRSNVKLYEYMGRKQTISDWVREITGRPDVIVRVGIKKLNG